MRFDPANVVVIANPVAAGGRVGRRWDALVDLIRGALGPVTVERTEAPGHATTLAREAVWAGRELVVSLGGDGTHSEVVAGVVRDRPGPDDVVIGVLPVGSGGDFRRMLHAGPSLEAHLELLCSSEPSAIDVGLVRLQTVEGVVERTFLNEVSVGTSGLVCTYVNRSSRKPLGGAATYFLNSVRAAATYQPLPMQVSVDGQRPLEVVPTMVMISNGRYAGGGMCISPAARLADGMLDVTVVEHRPWLGTVSLAPHYYRGTLVSSGSASGFRGNHIRIECPVDSAGPRPIVEADGDPVGHLPLEATVIAGGVGMLGVRPDLM